MTILLQYFAHELLSNDDMLPELKEHSSSSDIASIESDQAALGLCTSDSSYHHLK
mgnify:CR=1 FL=1